MGIQKLNRLLSCLICFIALYAPITKASCIYELTPPPYFFPLCDNRWLCNLSEDIERDFKTYFAPCNLLWFGNFFIASAILANTGLDKSFQTMWFFDISTSNNANRFFNYFNGLGNAGYYGLAIYLGAMGFGYWQNSSLAGNVLYTWGYRSLRTFFLGGLQQVILTHVLGSGRPSRNEPSKWQPFRYKNGVSGHALYGAIPFITAAMMTDPPLLRLALYAFSTLPGWARINNNSHYLSQVLLGWGIAYLTARTVYLSDQLKWQQCRIQIFPKYDGAMVHANWQF